ncbi:MAG: MBOAT family protein [Eubacteriales bacterium]|nr:MBOAT family protein [Eubacteriales bacterium]
MLFNSFTFLVFFIIVFTLYFLCPKKTRWLVLLGASIYFYASWNVAYIILIFCTIAVSYSAARLIEMASGKHAKRLLLIIAFVVCFDLLVMFKYYNFVTEIINGIWQTDLPLIYVLLPVGISFYTFQSFSYVVDVYRGLKAECNPLYYTLFVMFFPQLVAGPIERAGDLLPQLRSPQPFDYRRAVGGFHYVLWGLFKKCVIADSLCVAVDNVYGSLELRSGSAIIMATIFFAMQIYCDFSGYSDIAIGIGKILGYELTLNFRNPYFAKNIDEFWARWHITLSGWFRDYLYIPLGGNRKGRIRTYLNLFLTFLISGLWHGANLTFIIWGAFHGLLTVIYKTVKKPLASLTGRVHPALVFAGNSLSRLITFTLVCFGWIFFRADSPTAVKVAITKIFAPGGLGFADSFSTMGIDPTALKIICALTVVMFVVEYLRCEKGLFDKFAFAPVYIRTPAGLVLSAVIAAVLVYFSDGEVKPFVYFQF